MYKARLTELGAKRFGLDKLVGKVVEYETIDHPLKLVVTNVYLDGEFLVPQMGFTDDDRSIELITWPDDFDYQEA
jgi:hypothetical protein